MRLALTAASVSGASFALVPFVCASTTGNIVNDIADAYDFVIVGGGLAGLVLGSRLSEDANHTVLVLESGGTGEGYQERIDTPADAYFDSLWYTPLNWNFTTVAQANADSREMFWPRGKVLGGSSAINGLYMTRPGEIEVNAWRDLLEDMEGAEAWSWDSLYAAMKKSETFTPPTAAVAKEADISWTNSSHGTSGPIHMSYPGYTFPQVGQWITSLENIGVAASDDMFGGQNWGGAVSTSCINPSNWTRSYSRSGYLDGLPPRANYDVLPNAHVTRILFHPGNPSVANLTATGVEYTQDNGTTRLSVKVNKEVILAAGTIGSPTILLHSGVGPKDVLASAGVELVSEVPGVGQHLQDHLSATLRWSTDQVTAGSIFYDNGTDKNNPLYLSYINSAIAYVNSSLIFGAGASQFQSTTLAHLDLYTPTGSSDPTVIAGYKAIYNTTASDIFPSPLGQIELLLMNSEAGIFGITAALQHPYSHGQLYITSTNPMDPPVIDPSYLTHPSDVDILREGLKLARRLGGASPLKDNFINEVTPGSGVQSDQDWEDWLRGNTGTEYHPSSTCAMLPLDKGGVVDAYLRVYSLANVRVADASVPPTAFSSHLMSSTYGVAEQASEIIRTYYGASPSIPSNTASSSSSDGSSSSKSGDSQHRNAATTLHASIPLLTFAIYLMFRNLI